MTSLDENLNFPDPANVSVMPIAIRYGGIAALISIAITLLVDTLGLVNYGTGEGQWIVSVASLIITLSILYYAINQHKSDLGGYITFGRALKTGVMIGLIAGIIGGVFAAIYHGFIRPDIMETALEAQTEQMLDQGLSEEQIEQAMGISKMITGPIGLGLSSVIGSVFIYAILSLIMGAIMKKDPPMA